MSLIVIEDNMSVETKARRWRDEELRRTDVAATVLDYPNKDAILEWRQKLRDWPSTSDFPIIRPTKGSE